MAILGDCNITGIACSSISPPHNVWASEKLTGLKVHMYSERLKALLKLDHRYAVLNYKRMAYFQKEINTNMSQRELYQPNTATMSVMHGCYLYSRKHLSNSGSKE